MTVAELLGRMSSEELTEWQAYERLTGPLGPSRGDWHAAQVATMLVAVNKTKGRAPKISDHMLEWKGGGEQADALEMERTGKLLAEKLGGTWTPGRDADEATGGDDE